MKFNLLKTFKIIRQREEAECGLACIAMILAYSGCPNVLPYLRMKHKVRTEGISLHQMEMIFSSLNYDTESYKAEYDFLLDTTSPCIVHLDQNHFVVLYRCDQQYVWLADPANGKIKLPVKDFVSRWTGIVLQISLSREFDPAKIQTLYIQHQETIKDVRHKHYYPALKTFKIIFIIAILPR